MMVFFGICGLLGLVVVVWLGRAMRESGAQAAQDPSRAVYLDQLRDVERDTARGLLNAEDAARTRTEIARKLLAVDAAGAEVLGQSGLGRPLLAGAAVVIFGVSFWTYLSIGAPGYGDLPLQPRLAALEDARQNRPDQAAAEAQARPLMPLTAPDAQTETLMAELRKLLQERPNDLEGHQLLARNEAALGNYGAAWRAQAHVVTLLGAQVQAHDVSTTGELMVLAAGGYVSPEAEGVFRRALQMDGRDGSGRYYLGLMYAQGGRADLAFGLWKRLIADSPADAPWLAPIYAQIEEISVLAGDPTPLDALPQPLSADESVDQSAPLPGPTAADIEAAGAMSMEERMGMVRGMVERLSTRLATEGGPPQDWARLINALGVLGDLNGAAQVWEEGRMVFADNPGALDLLAGAADRAGLAPQ